VIGFDTGLEVQSESAITGLRLFFSGLPILGTLGAIYIMRNYEITEERAKEISDALAARKA
jgi:GPH family glycoside/pentoside/hexuronide:cation symporter